MKILTVVGARPQFVKAAVVGRAISERATAGASVCEEIVHTGQHYDHGMSRVFFEEMRIAEPVVNLNVGSGRQGETTGAMIAGIEAQILARRPTCVLLYGDTNSTLAGALAAVKLHVPIAHVEAGLRSFNKRMPEETNRVVADRCADLLFCPSEHAREQLAREGIEAGVHVVGDVMVDALVYYRRLAPVRAPQPPFALATLHRAENTDDVSRLRAILDGLTRCPVPVLLPLHPRTREVLRSTGITTAARVRLTDPVSYLEMLGHLQACSFVITDSGGLQKEAYMCGKKCITVRDETEWTELVAHDANRVTGADPERICAAYAWASQPLTTIAPIYGDGHAGEHIVDVLLHTFGAKTPSHA